MKSDEVRANLLYAACQGGNIECFKLWITPGIDINQSISLVESERDLGEFEKNTPLYAVCSGEFCAMSHRFFDSVPDDKILGLSKLKAIADNKLNVIRNVKLIF